MSTSTEKEALERASALCARSEYCERDILSKLSLWGVDPSLRPGIIQRLREMDFINPERFALAFVRDKARFQRWGPLKIRQALSAKGIGGAILESAMAILEDDLRQEQDGALRVLLLRKCAELDRKGVEPAVRKRGLLIRSALTRGFQMEDILRAVEEMGVPES